MAQFKALTMADLIGSEMLLLEDGHCLREHALDVCLTAGVKEDRRFHATSLETLRHMVGEGMGITLLPELSIPRGHTSNDEIRYIPFADPEPARRIGMLYRKGSYRTESFEQIAQVIKSVMEQRVASNLY